MTRSDPCRCAAYPFPHRSGRICAQVAKDAACDTDRQTQQEAMRSSDEAVAADANRMNRLSRGGY